MQKTKSTFRKAKTNEKLEKTSSFAAEAGLRLRLLKSTCATEVGFSTSAMASDPKYGCRRSELEGATRVDLYTWAMDFRPKVRLPP
jgi:hypothetical protein